MRPASHTVTSCNACALYVWADLGEVMFNNRELAASQDESCYSLQAERRSQECFHVGSTGRHLLCIYTNKCESCPVSLKYLSSTAVFV